MTKRTAQRAARFLEASPFVATGCLLVAFLIGAATASFTPTRSGIDGFAPIVNGFVVGLLALGVVQSVTLLTIGIAAIVLVRDAARNGPGLGWARATIGGSIAAGALIVASGALALASGGASLDSPDLLPWSVAVAWGTRVVGAATLAGLVMVLRARGGLPRWGRPLIAACLATPIIHVLGVPVLDSVAFFAVICMIGTAWRLQLAAETPCVPTPVSVVITPL